MLNREDRDEFYRIMTQIDHNTLVDLLDSYMSDKEKKEFIESYKTEA